MSRSSRAAVQDGRLVHCSISQIRDFQRCPRLWAAKKIFGLEPPRTKSQTRGVDHHSEAERYYHEGIEPRNEAFLAALPGLPQRAPELLVETSLVDPVLYIEDTRFDGFCDLVVPPVDGPLATLAHVLDHKFVGSFRYVQDPANDLQMLTYGYWVSRRWPEIRELRLTLAYYIAEGTSDFRIVSKVVPVERCESEWQDVVVPTVQKMRALVASAPLAFGDVTPRFDDDYAACRQYGGCYFARKCGVDLKTKSAKLSSIEAAVLAAFDRGLSTRGN